ncbi:MAG: PD-(D/E)XK nuclease family protein [Prevotella sp.]|nr:PD-(D/E)XK nuclease family protein [Prevotella sp.]
MKAPFPTFRRLPVASFPTFRRLPVAFLEHVAEDILNKYGHDLNSIAVVFPNKRASLFLNEYLARQAGSPVWSPAYITISDLLRQQSQRTVADPIKLVCELYKSFTQQTGIDETLDHFYGWGELLLADFDDIDKHMVDADKVLANLRDLHEMDDVSYLTEEQKATIRHFFSYFSDDHNTKLKERFLKLWSHMADIYHDFNRRLSEQQLAYEGALYREAVEHLNAPDVMPGIKTFLFVGFNLVQPVEQQLFLQLMREGRARFYWDFDHYYLDSEAGHYISQLMARFPNELDTADDDIYRCFTRPKNITFVSAPTENIQARYVSKWLTTDNRIADGRQTAVVLCNEGLLETVVHCLPDDLQHVNVTTGYPLSHTPVASLVTLLVNLRTIGYDTQRQRFRYRHLKALMRHPYIAPLADDADMKALINRSIDSNTQMLQWLCDILKKASANPSKSSTDSIPADAQERRGLFSPSSEGVGEAFFRAYTLLNRLLNLVVSGDLTIDAITLGRLITQLVRNATIPFHGEPAEGLQIMGVLETRCLDFRHLLLLSCNEGNIPAGTSDTSFIPYSLRKAYGLTTLEHKTAIYSYYFHRLLQRADDVTILYNNATTDGQRGEQSRFMLQLMVESPHTVNFQTLQAGQTIIPFAPQPVPKGVPNDYPPIGPAPLLTPTAVNRYMRCPLQYYYCYVHGLREPDVTDDDTIDNRIFGNIFHNAAQDIYTQLTQRSQRIQADDLRRLLNTRVEIERAVDTAIINESSPNPAAVNRYTGMQLLSREVIIHYLRQLLTIDLRLTPFTILALETDVKTTLATDYGDVNIGGRIDRLDIIGTPDGHQRIRVVDYKTGSHQGHPLPNVSAIFTLEALVNHSDYYLQAILYATIVSQSHEGTPVSPALLFIQHAAGPGYDPTLLFGRQPITDVATIRQEFIELLRRQISEIFNPDIPFTPTTDRSRCQNCPYKQLCLMQGARALSPA